MAQSGSIQQNIDEKSATLALECVFPRPYRVFTRRALLIVSCFFLLADIGRMAEGVLDGIGSVSILTLSLLVLLILFEAFSNSHYFRPSVLPFSLSLIIYKSGGVNVSKALLGCAMGDEIAKRLSLGAKEKKELIRLYDGKKILFNVNKGAGSVEEFAGLLWKSDQNLSQFLFAKGASEHSFVRAVAWTTRVERERREAKRWWGERHLRKFGGIGADWAFGETKMLSRYGRFIGDDLGAGSLFDRRHAYADDVASIERVLLKREGANVLIVASDTHGAFEALAALAVFSKLGEGTPELAHFRFFLIDGKRLIEDFGEQAKLEVGLSHLLYEATRVGNVIVCFDNLPGFAQSAKSLGTDITAILDQYLRSNTLRVIGLSDAAGFHTVLEPHKSLMANFEHIELKSAEGGRLLELLEDAIVPLEKKYRLVFSIGAIEAIIKSAERFFTDKDPEDAVFDLLYELIPELVHKGKRHVSADDVHALSEEKTGIPQTVASDSERAELLSLEETLKRRIVGQDEAVSLISSALRRARAGVGDEKKPIGSFLFIGPTGVGKTETTKALAESFFGSEDKIVRFDMSEYATVDAVDKLIGSYLTATPGVLSSKIKESPYAVLLLDEFEKTNPRALDIFLQVLDEGVFSDGRGERVSVRNMIIIATSNAGSDLMYETMKRTGVMNLSKSDVVDEVIARGIFKPELVNRFDGIVLFSPLTKENLREIAGLVLGRLSRRLKDKGVELMITEPLIESLMETGMDPKFGARALVRVVKDKVENAIAIAMLSGIAHTGTKIEIVPDSTSVEGFRVEVR